MCSTVITCPLCSQPNFTSINSLQISLIKVTNRPLACPICNEVVLGLDKLTIHLVSHTITYDHEEINLTTDQFVGKTNATTTLIDPIAYTSTSDDITQQAKNFHGSNQGQCLPSITDDPIYTNDIQYIQPAQYSQNDPSTSIVSFQQPSPTCDLREIKTNNLCDICGIHFDSTDLLKMHNELFHDFENKPKPKEFQCHLCTRNFKAKGSLRVHYRVVHMGLSRINQLNKSERNEQKSENPYSVTQSIVPNSDETGVYSPTSSTSINSPCLDTQPTKTWECDICAKSFTTKYFLKKHKRLHTGEMPYTCEQCGKTFTFQQSYHKHLSYHSDQKPYTCNTCGRSFKELSTLHNHERIHTGEKPYECETCGKCFRQRVSYLVHKRIHTNEMPYKCTACNKNFRYKVSQRTHKCTSEANGSTIIPTEDLVDRLLRSSNSLNANESTQSLNDVPNINNERILYREQQIHSPHSNEPLIDFNQSDDCIPKLIKPISNEIKNQPPLVLESFENNRNDVFNQMDLNSSADRLHNLSLNSINENFFGNLDTLNNNLLEEFLLTSNISL